MDGSHQMTAGAKEILHESVHREKSLRLCRGLEPPHLPALVHDSKLTDSEPNPEASHRPIRYDSGRPRSVI